MTDQDLEMLVEDLEAAGSVDEIQTAVLLLNERLDADEEVETQSLGGQSTKIDILIKWMSTLRERLEELEESGEFSSYSVTVGGSITGPSISVTVTESFN